MSNTKNHTIDTKYKILIFAAVLRIAFFAVDLFVGAINIDEAMASINAFEIAKTGNDLLGTHLPLYFDCWLYGGQSPVAIYLAAASVKLLGATKFAVRLPVLIFNILSLWAYFEFVFELFERKRYRIILCCVAAISPWSIFSASFFLDCNYVSFFILFGLYFLIKAIKQERSLLFAVAMLCFGICFYCYMASVLIIPFLLAAVYLQLLISKRINTKNLLISIVVVFVVAVPFIALGLVTLGVIPRMSFLGFSLTNMEYYTRQATLAFANGNSVVKNFLTHVLNIFCIDFTILSELNNKYQFSNLLGGLFVAFEFLFAGICFVKGKRFNFIQRVFLLSAIACVVIYCLLLGEAGANCFYRYAPINYFLLFIEGVGVTELSLLAEKHLKVQPLGKKILVSYLAVSLALFTGSYAFLYVPQAKTTFLYLYGDTYYETIETAQELGYNDFTIHCGNNGFNKHLSVFSRYYFYGEKEFIDWKEEAVCRLNGTQPEQLATDGSIRFSTETTLTSQCCIYPQQLSEQLNKDGYTVIDANGWEVAYKP